MPSSRVCTTSERAPTLPENHLTPQEIADLSGSTRQAVSNWQRRHEDFPQPVAFDGRTPLFAEDPVVKWLRQNGKLVDTATSNVTLAISILTDAFRVATEDLSADAILKTVVTPALREIRAPGLFNEALLACHDRFGSEATAVAIVEVLTRSPGHKFDQFLVPEPVRDLVYALVGSEFIRTVYDGCAGAGTLAITAGEIGSKYFLQDLDSDVADFAAAILQYRGIEVEVRTGDTIANDLHPSVRADVVVMAPPPESWRVEPNPNDPRWEFARPSANSSELWIQIALAHTDAKGSAILHLPSSILEPTADGLLEQLLRRNVLDAVIDLGPRLLGGSSRESCLLVLDKGRPSPTATAHVPILLARIARADDSTQRRSRIDVDDVANFVDDVLPAWRSSRAIDIEGRAITVALPDIAATGFDFRPQRHLERLDWPRPPLGNGTHPSATELNELSATARLRAQVQPPEISCPEIRIERAPVTTLSALMQRRAVNVVRGSSFTSRREQVDGESPRVVEVEDLIDNLLAASLNPIGRDRPELDRSDQTESRNSYVRSSDILIPLRWRGAEPPRPARATPEMQGRILGSSIAALRLRDSGHDFIDPTYLAWWLATPKLTHFLKSVATGNVFRRISVNSLVDFEFPLPPLNDQHAIVGEFQRLIASLQQAHTTHQELADLYKAAGDSALELFGAITSNTNQR